MKRLIKGPAAQRRHQAEGGFDFLTLICTRVDILSRMCRRLHRGLFTIPPWPPNQAQFLHFTSEIDEAEITHGRSLRGKLASLLARDPQVTASSLNSSLSCAQLQHFHRVQLKQSRDLKKVPYYGKLTVLPSNNTLIFSVVSFLG